MSYFNSTGGIIGDAADVMINNCTNNATVSGFDHVGGLVGTLSGSANSWGDNSWEIHTSLNTGNISGNAGSTGGLLGDYYNFDCNHVYSCYTNQGMINGTSANSNNQIGRGKAVENCPFGHTKR